MTLNDLIAGLAGRLEDPLSGNSFYSVPECQGYLIDTLRLWNAATGYWRSRDLFPAQAPPARGTRWYDLGGVLTGGSLVRSVTDSEALGRMVFQLCETVATDQFPSGSPLQALSRRRDQFLGDSGCVLGVVTTPMGGPPTSRVVLPSTVLDIRRVAWVDGTTGLSWALSREDEVTIQGYDPAWTDPGLPSAYSSSTSPPFTLQLAPQPSVPGSVEVLCSQVGPVLTGTGVTLGLPDDLAMGAMWGALADLLGGDLPGSDPLRAQYCESRYREYVSLARMAQSVLRAQVGGVDLDLGTPWEADGWDPGWEQVPGPVSRILMAGLNLLGLSAPSVSGAEQVTVDLVTNAPVNTGGDLGLTGDLGDVILDHAEHQALFKAGGAEFQASFALRDRFWRKASQVNSKLMANAAFWEDLRGKARKSRAERPTGADQPEKVEA